MTSRAPNTTSSPSQPLSSAVGANPHADVKPFNLGLEHSDLPLVSADTSMSFECLVERLERGELGSVDIREQQA